MAHYLLMGAGFSRNWGGWLAAEVFEYLIGNPEIAGNAGLRKALWDAQSKGGFEYALEMLRAAALQGESEGAKKLAILRVAVIAMFNEMNGAFDSIQDWEFSNQADRRVALFLTKFEALFTLNQDLFIERHYLSADPSLLRKDRWDGAAMPGLASTDMSASSIVEKRWQVLEEETFKIEGRIQPFFKLHGSTNWDSPDGKDTLIIGGNKTGMIGSTPILKWYFDQFQNAMLAGDSRLMTIGYGFRDPHINEVLIEGINKRGLKIFVVSPAGADQAKEVNKTAGGVIFEKAPLDEAFETGLIGASQRGLAEIFGRNGLEFAKLQRFLST